MSALSEFDEVYSQLYGSRPLYVSLKHIMTGIPRWRLQVFEEGTAPTGGDMLLLCIERPTEEECLRVGTEELRKLIR